jgi:hypothetical protein
MATFGGRIRHTSREADIRVTCFPIQDNTTRVFVAEYPRDRDLVIGFLTWQCCRFLPLNPLLEFDWQLGFSSDELSNAKSCILSGIQRESTSLQTSLVRFTESLRRQGDKRYDERAYAEAMDLYQSCQVSLLKWPGLLDADTWDKTFLLCLSRMFRASMRLNQCERARGTPCLPALVHLILSSARISFGKRSRCLYFCARIAEACGRLATAYALGDLALALCDDKRVDKLIQRLTRSPTEFLAESVPVSIIQSLERRPASEEDETVECTVCLCSYTSGQILLPLSCSHEFHEGCIVPWLNRSDTCPICRCAVKP